MSGVELLARLRAFDADLPVVLLTAAPTLESAVEAVTQGATGYLIKPQAIPELVETLRRGSVLRRLKRAQREAQGRGGLGARTPQEWTELEEAVERTLCTMKLHFQPIVRGGPGETKAIGYEALLRTGDPVLRDPPSLIAASRAVGRSHQLGRRVRELAATAIQRAPAGTDVFVNMTTSDLLDPALYDARSLLGPVSRRVVLELTEGGSFEDVHDIKDRVRALRELGYRVALDDLGSGYAALESLVELRPDVAKICMSIVRDVHRDELRGHLVGTLVDFCRRLGMPVVCEGVETTDELEALRGMGAEYFQGYLFGRPTPGFEVPAQL